MWTSTSSSSATSWPTGADHDHGPHRRGTLLDGAHPHCRVDLRTHDEHRADPRLPSLADRLRTDTAGRPPRPRRRAGRGSGPRQGRVASTGSARLQGPRRVLGRPPGRRRPRRESGADRRRRDGREPRPRRGPVRPAAGSPGGDLHPDSCAPHCHPGHRGRGRHRTRDRQVLRRHRRCSRVRRAGRRHRPGPRHRLAWLRDDPAVDRGWLCHPVRRDRRPARRRRPGGTRSGGGADRGRISAPGRADPLPQPCGRRHPGGVGRADRGRLRRRESPGRRPGQRRHPAHPDGRAELWHAFHVGLAADPERTRRRDHRHRRRRSARRPRPRCGRRRRRSLRGGAPGRTARRADRPRQ